MLSINGFVNTRGILRNLDANLRTQSSAMEKLASGLRINKASDDPSGLLISEQLRSQIKGLERAIQNTEDADNILSITDGALGIVQGVLNNMRELTVAAANTGVSSPEQIAGLQAGMDASLQSISRIMETTNVAGRKLLDYLQDDGKLNLGKAAGKQGRNAAGVIPEGESPAGGVPVLEPSDLDEDGGADDSLARQREALDKKDKALFDLANSMKGSGLSSLGSVTLPGELNGLLGSETLTLEDLYSGGAASLANDPVTAMRIVESAGRDIRTQRAFIGATMSLRANERAAMEAQLENTMRVESGIRDTDFAETMTEYARSQVISQAGLRILDAAQEQNQSILELFA
jgi:flagellin